MIWLVTCFSNVAIAVEGNKIAEREAPKIPGLFLFTFVEKKPGDTGRWFNCSFSNKIGFLNEQKLLHFVRKMLR